ncbi:hypothetical protein GCM10027277_59390 [Pseudoduganella ginsengisoli]|uniref:Uncharacterized protein n=1 Tax=Pseudoduganella ginsengisoli TaxID=1462440 RepID=A0A6L6QA25_9BURK|nr:hypothetical protein [Pseudoduganella ginsengisoli]MTW06324.1 hypothetical protein [Pseudoduganella ginsengisoli]
MARIPLISASELDKERNREAERRGKIAEAVGSLVAARAERVMQTRQLSLLQALEKRAQERVRIGVAETSEQVHYLEQVAALETRIQALQGDEIKARWQVKTGSMAELAITVAIVALCAVVIYTRREVPGTFIPFFYRYDRLYKEGLIDGHEWKQHRFDFISASKTHKTD